MSLNNNLAKNLNAIRQNRNISITDFAEELCIARSSLQKILKGDCNLRMDTVNQISEHLHTDPLTLLQEPSAPRQSSTSLPMLNCIETYRNMSYSDRKKANELFEQLVALFDQNSKV